MSSVELAEHVSSCWPAAISGHSQRTSNVPKVIGKTGSVAKRSNGTPSRALRATDHLKTDAERAAYLEALLGDGDNRVITIRRP